MKLPKIGFSLFIISFIIIGIGQQLKYNHLEMGTLLLNIGLILLPITAILFITYLFQTKHEINRTAWNQGDYKNRLNKHHDVLQKIQHKF